MYPASSGESESGPTRESIVELFSRLATDSAGLIHDEIDLAKEEMCEKARSLKKGMIGVAVSIVLAMFALGTLDIALVLTLGKRIGLELSAAVVGIIILIAAGILAGWGIARIRRTSLKPEAAIRSLKEDGEWLRRMAGIR